jgi:hypothetical protein
MIQIIKYITKEITDQIELFLAFMKSQLLYLDIVTIYFVHLKKYFVKGRWKREAGQTMKDLLMTHDWCQQLHIYTFLHPSTYIYRPTIRSWQKVFRC